MKVMKARKKFVVKQARMPDGLSSTAGVTIHEGEHVLFIGVVNNMNGTVAISTWDGTVLWPINLSDLEEI
jgi:hypothetical protein